MLDVQSLERQWLRYKLKSYLPYLSIILISFIGYATYSMMMPSKNTATFTQPLNPPPSKSKSLHPIDKSNDVILEPSMTFMESMDSTIATVTSLPITGAVSQSETIKHAPVAVTTPLPKETFLQPVAPQKETVPIKPMPVEKKSPSTIVKREDSPLNINELQDRFQNTPNANLGVFIAKYHYDHGNYTEAYNYALKTNALNNKIEESWIIFAKSLVKLGKTDQARKTLQLYISQSNSTTAKAYLDSLDKESPK